MNRIHATYSPYFSSIIAIFQKAHTWLGTFGSGSNVSDGVHKMAFI